MKFLILDKNNKEIVNTLDDTCKECYNQNVEYFKKICPNKAVERRYGIKQSGNGHIFICTSSNDAKTTKLFKEKVEMLVHCISSFSFIKDKIIADTSSVEKHKYSQIVHNLKTLNAQSIQNQYKFIPQHVYADNFNNLYDFLKNEIVSRPHDATIAILRLTKNNAHMKTEFSTHEKLSVENPNLLLQEHNIRSVILNVYHSFDIDFRENNIQFKINDTIAYVLFDYDTVRVALYHMFSNTIKYMLKNTKLSVIITKKDDFTFVEFNMKSLHIGKDEKTKIFEDSYSGRSTFVKHKNGSGLGMGLIKKALEINKAQIEVISGERMTKIEGQDYSENIFRLIFKNN